ncbi:MAG: ATP-binding cassette domain-containing protein [Myxococcales bacterium]|nr:ATP-binding cassette domain-containing protein [Myxococcales bacterium]
MSFLRWLFALRAARVASAACAASGMIKSLALPLAIWVVNNRPEGWLFAALAVGYAGLAVTAYLTDIRSSDALAAVLGDVIHTLRLSIVDRVRRAELRVVEQNQGTLALMTRDLEDLRAVSGLMQGYLRAAFEILGYLLYAFSVAGLGTLALIAGLGWLFWGMLNNARAQRLALSDYGAREEAVGRGLNDLWTGMPRFLLDRPAMRAVRDEVRLRRHQLDETLAAHDRAESVSAAFNMAQPLIMCGLLTLLVTGPFGLSGTAAFAFVSIIFMTRGPSFALLGMGRIVLAERALERLCALERTLATAEIGLPGAQAGLVDRLELRKVVFRFEDGFAVGPIGLTFRPGELVFVVGHNGSGKTTLMKIMSGLYPASHGKIYLNGKSVSRAALRAHFTVTFADAWLFERPYGLDATPEQIAAALAEVGLGGVVDLCDGAFEPLELSTGQQRRLALAVALLERRPIAIFDEWDAHQDPETKRWYFETLLPRLAREGRVVIAVCHDARYFAAADRVIEMKSGQVLTDSVASSSAEVHE